MHKSQAPSPISALSADLIFPDPSLILLIGPSGVGKSTFAAAHFNPTETISSDRCRALISDDENNQNVNREAFELLHHIAGLRLRLNRLTVVDATNLQDWGRASLLNIARAHSAPVVAVAFNIPLEVALARNRRRSHRVVDEEVIKQHFQELDETLPRLSREGYATIYILSETDLDTARIVRQQGLEKLISTEKS